ncbi:hypothetical protein [Sphingobium sp. Leaf26]|nr:hypothetical protein [Sphingobium sp. Leaf26]
MALVEDILDPQYRCDATRISAEPFGEDWNGSVMFDGYAETDRVQP